MYYICIIFYYIVLYYIILYIILYHIILYHIILYTFGTRKNKRDGLHKTSSRLWSALQDFMLHHPKRHGPITVVPGEEFDSFHPLGHFGGDWCLHRLGPSHCDGKPGVHCQVGRWWGCRDGGQLCSWHLPLCIHPVLWAEMKSVSETFQMPSGSIKVLITCYIGWWWLMRFVSFLFRWLDHLFQGAPALRYFPHFPNAEGLPAENIPHHHTVSSQSSFPSFPESSRSGLLFVSTENKTQSWDALNKTFSGWCWGPSF